jgi:predicted GNAT family acetyltransferase
MTESAIAHDAAARRFTVELDGHRAELEYQLHDGTLTITHTGVPEAIGGRGIASRLVEAAFAHARSAGLKVRPACSYAAAWVERHPEVTDLLG